MDLHSLLDRGGEETHSQPPSPFLPIPPSLPTSVPWAGLHIGNDRSLRDLRQRQHIADHQRGLLPREDELACGSRKEGGRKGGRW